AAVVPARERIANHDFEVVQSQHPANATQLLDMHGACDSCWICLMPGVHVPHRRGSLECQVELEAIHPSTMYPGLHQLLEGVCPDRPVVGQTNGPVRSLDFIP